MTEYYYSKHPNVVHHLRRLYFKGLENKIQLISDNGVFSKSAVDYGSRVVINNFNAQDLPEGPFLDLGCGYGPIGIALAKRYPHRMVTMTDVNDLALDLSRKNAKLNHINNVKIFSSNVYDQITGHFAAIITNPPIRAGKKVVSAILKGAVNYLVAKGTLTVVIRRKQGEPSAKKLMKTVFGNCKIVKRDKGYYVLKSIRDETTC